MNAMQHVEAKVQYLPVSDVRRGPLARRVDDAVVRSIMRSARDSGIMQPLRVRNKDGSWEIIFGGHRHEAARRLGLDTVPCIVTDDDDLDAELAMIDENLCRAELSPAERASATARRKAIYEERHPETKHGATGSGRTKDRVANLAGLNDAPADSFADETARVTKRSLRSVARDAERGEKIAPDVLDRIKGTELDSGNFLDFLRRQYDKEDQDGSFEKQREIVAKGTYDPPPPDPDVVEARQLATLQSAWTVASDKVRTTFLSWLDEKGIAWPSEQKS